MSPARIDLQALTHYALARSLFAPTTLPRALARLGFVQADPIRAPARAQDLTLRQRVAGYRAGDLEARYPRLALEEDFFVNYGYLPRRLQALMHPRTRCPPLPRSHQRQAGALLDFVRERGVVHPRDVEAHFQHGTVRNWFGGNSRAGTQLLDALHYRGWLRVARREAGVRLYALREPTEALLPVAQAEDALVDIVVNKYAPLPERSLAELVLRLRHGVPQWAHRRTQALARTKARLPRAVVDGVTWYWRPGENPASRRHADAGADRVALLAPFDPVVWDRRRFELFWGWAYRFEAYTPAPKRVRGYYALPLLWRDRVIGWANLTQTDGRLAADFGYVGGQPPREAAYRRALDEELARMQAFLQPRATTPEPGAAGAAPAPASAARR